jgi:CRISPR-associated protein Cmr6
MSSVNLGWLFYKDYYEAIKDWSDIKAYEKDISKKVDELIEKSITIEQVETLGNIHFNATTTYPGLLLGSGYSHELPSVEGQAILGFDFDYTSGLPIIRGSSIKGVLRGAFKHQDYIKELLNQDVDIESLEEEIFENGDIFFDAVIISSGKILGDDYLAPHKDDPLKNPIPLRFIKIMPNVTFRFDFELGDGVVTKENKAILFGAILHDLGIGAKTNVGYGKFSFNDVKEQLHKQVLNDKIENASSSKEKIIAIIEKFQKPNENLFKKLKEEEIIDIDKDDIYTSFTNKYEDNGSKWYKKIIKLLESQ